MEASLVGRLLMLTPLPYSLLADTTLLGALNGHGHHSAFSLEPSLKSCPLEYCPVSGQYLLPGKGNGNGDCNPLPRT